MLTLTVSCREILSSIDEDRLSQALNCFHSDVSICLATLHDACFLQLARVIVLLVVQGLHVMASSWPATAYMLHKKDAPALLSEPTVLETASRIGKHASQVLIRWSALSVKSANLPFEWIL